MKAARLSQRGNRRATTNAMNEKRLQSLRDLAETQLALYSEKDLKVISNYLSRATKVFREATAKVENN